MSYGGDIVRFVPGRDIPVEVVADADGTVAGYADGVELVGENENHVEVALVSAPGQGIGQLATDPEDELTNPTDGDNAGAATLHAWYPVFVSFPVADVDDVEAGIQELAVGDAVMFDAGGKVTAYDETAAATPWGRVFRTLADNKATAGKVQVIRSGR